MPHRKSRRRFRDRPLSSLDERGAPIGAIAALGVVAASALTFFATSGALF